MAKEKIGIIVDSSCGISKEIIEKNKGSLLSIPIMINGKEYTDGVDMNDDILLNMLKPDTKISTSSIGIEKWEKEFAKFEKLFDKIICITLSSELSSTNDFAKFAAKGHKNIYVIDSKLASYWANYGVNQAIKMIKDGKDVSKIMSYLNELGEKAIGCFTTNTLIYLKNGGRISSSAALVGNALKILPIITWKDGMMDSKSASKARTFEKAKIKTIDSLKKNWDTIIDKDNYLVGVVVSQNMDKNEIDAFVKNVKRKLDLNYTPKFSPMGAALIAHIGPVYAGVGIVWKGKE